MDHDPGKAGNGARRIHSTDGGFAGQIDRRGNSTGEGAPIGACCNALPCNFCIMADYPAVTRSRRPEQFYLLAASNSMSNSCRKSPASAMALDAASPSRPTARTVAGNRPALGSHPHGRVKRRMDRRWLRWRETLTTVETRTRAPRASPRRLILFLAAAAQQNSGVQSCDVACGAGGHEAKMAGKHGRTALGRPPLSGIIKSRQTRAVRT